MKRWTSSLKKTKGYEANVIMGVANQVAASRRIWQFNQIFSLLHMIRKLINISSIITK